MAVGVVVDCRDELRAVMVGGGIVGPGGGGGVLVEPGAGCVVGPVVVLVGVGDGIVSARVVGGF